MEAEFDLRFLTFDEPHDIGAMHDPDEDADERERKNEGMRAEEPGPEGTQGRCGQGRKRGDAEEEGHDKPNGEEDEAKRPIEAEQDSDIGGDALATLEAQPDGKQMPGKSGK